MDPAHSARTKDKVDHGLSAAAVALLDSIRIESEPPTGWVTAQQFGDYLGVSKNAAVQKMKRIGWERVLIQRPGRAPAYYYGPK